MNTQKEWRKLLRQANKELKPKGLAIRIEKEDDMYYSCDIYKKGVRIKEYASGFFETELEELVNDALTYARSLPAGFRSGKRAFLISLSFKSSKALGQVFQDGSFIFVAEDEEAAKKKAIDLFSFNSKPYDVNVKSCTEIGGDLGKITVLMDDFSSVDIGIPILGESTIVSLDDGLELKVETVSNESGNLFVTGYADDGTGQFRIFPISRIRDEDLSLILDSLECAVGENARPFLRQALLLKDLVDNRPDGSHIPAGVLSLPGVCKDAGATRISDETGTAALVHWDLTGDYTRALLIPRNEFEDIDRVIEALDSFVTK